MRFLSSTRTDRRARHSQAVTVPDERVIWGEEALQLAGWPSGFDFERALQVTDAFRTYVLRFIQVCGVHAHQRELAAIAALTGWSPGSAPLSPPLLVGIRAADPDELIGPPASVGPHQIGYAPRGIGPRLPPGAYAGCLGAFGDIIGAKVFLPDERSSQL